MAHTTTDERLHRQRFHRYGLAFAALLGGIIGVCALLAQAIELRNRDVRRWLDRKLVVPGRTPATA